MELNKRQKDWTNRKFNKLTLTKPISKTPNNKIIWEAICDCGKVINIIPYQVASGHTKSCGLCIGRSSYKKWHGIKRYNLTFIEPYKKSKNDQMIWVARCDCGNHIKTIPSNYAKSCGCLKAAYYKENCSKLGKSTRKYSSDEAVARKVWQRYKDGDIEFIQFHTLSQLKCYYCGIEPNTTYIYLKMVNILTMD